MLKYKKPEFIKMSFRNANIKSELYCGCTYQYNTTIDTNENIIAMRTEIKAFTMNAVVITFIKL